MTPSTSEGVACARRLRQAGVPAKLMVYHDTVHGFWVWANRLARGAEAVADVGREVRDLCRRSPR